MVALATLQAGSAALLQPLLELAEHGIVSCCCEVSHWMPLQVHHWTSASHTKQEGPHPKRIQRTGGQVYTLAHIQCETGKPGK